MMRLARAAEPEDGGGDLVGTAEAAYELVATASGC